MRIIQIYIYPIFQKSLWKFKQIPMIISHKLIDFATIIQTIALVLLHGI